MPNKKKNEFDPYSIDKFDKIPMGVKVFITKWWLAGAVCYFGSWGLGLLISDSLDQALATGIILGACIEILLNNIIRYLMPDKDKTKANKYILITSKKYLAFILNLLYGIAMGFLIAYSYNYLNIGIISLFNLDPTSVPIGTEPILYGLFFYGFDFIFLSVKHYIMNIKNKKNDQKNEVAK